MGRILTWVVFVSLLLSYSANSSIPEEEKQLLLDFFQKLTGSALPTDPNFGWNATSDPCTDNWNGTKCESQFSVKKIFLENLSFNGVLDLKSVCLLQSLTLLSIQNNSISGEVSEDIGNCRQLTHLLVNDNKLSGNVPASLSHLNNLKRLSISNNDFSGQLPDLSKISGLISFLGQKNQLSGSIPELDFTNLQQFNVSFNKLTGPVPEPASRFDLSSFDGNPGLCGKPLPNPCTPPKKRSKISKGEPVLMFLGYIVLGAALIALAFLILSKRKKTEDTVNVEGERKEKMETDGKSSYVSDYKVEVSKSEYSVPLSTESPMLSSSLIVPRSSAMKGWSFDDLLKAPAELLGRGKNSSTYKVEFQEGRTLAVKRIKDWSMSGEEFRRRMEKMDQVKHPNILPPFAYYYSKEEKLVIYEYQQNGSLNKLLNGVQSGYTFDWSSRLSVAASLAEGLAFMHKEFYKDGIGHGNLKSANVLMNKNMDACISEYGVMVIDDEPFSLDTKPMDRNHPDYPFKADIYKFGVILLELLTGRIVQSNGSDLATWVHSVVREEWTAEVFDKALFTEGASEQRMVNLLQVALKCINPSPEARPSINQVTLMISNIKEEEERSIVSEI